MNVSVYLHPDIVQIMKNFGTVEEVANRIVDETIDDISIGVLPKAPGRDGARRYDLDIRNETFYNLVYTYGANSTRCSIRRLIYWFIENEVYVDNGWESIEYDTKVADYLLNKVSDMRSSLSKMSKYLDFEAKEIQTNINTLLVKLEENINNGKRNKQSNSGSET